MTEFFFSLRDERLVELVLCALRDGISLGALFRLSPGVVHWIPST